MGWTSYNAKFYKNGKVDRKAECDSIFENDATCELVESSMRGSVYYAAVKLLKKYVGSDEDGKSVYEDLTEPSISAYVILTSVDNSDYFNFAYKDMHETMGPFQYDCPQKILDLLTPTDNEFANKWREECRKLKENKNDLGKLKVGDSVKCTINGEEMVFTKTWRKPFYKKPIWYCEKRNSKISSKLLNQVGYTLVEQEGEQS